MKIIPYAELDTIFLDVGNTLISMDFAWVTEELAAQGVYCEVQALRRAEAAARPIVSKGLARRTTEGQDAFRFYLGTVLSCLPGTATLPTSQINRISRDLAPVLRPTGQAERLWSYVIPGVPAALNAFKKCGLQLVAVSNSDGTVEDVLIRQRLRPYFTAVYDSYRVGFEKPDPRIFHRAINELNIEPSRTLHVGDLYNIDITGARSAGLHTILVDPFGDWTDVDCVCIRDLSELSQKVIEAHNTKKST
jgi:HAD superfamily hydrolase (TIGR01662 family)